MTSAVTSPTITSTVTTGTAPLTVASTTKVTNLNADQVDGTSVLRGTGTLVAGTVTIANTNVTANSIIMVTGQTDSGGFSSHGSLTIGTRVPGTSFVINSSIATDTRLVGYVIVEP